MTLAKAITKTLDISVEDVRIDLTATIRSYDLTDTQFIFEIKSSNGMTVNLTGSTAMYIVEYVHNSQTYAIQGNVDIIGTDTLSFNLPEDLKGYSGTVLIGIYVKLTDGTKIDIKDIAVRIEPSIMDKDIDFSAKTYFKDFESVKAEVVLEGEKAKTDINAVLPSVKAEISEIKTDIENLPDIPDLFVAYADNINGSGFSKTDTTKLYKGYGVKNSNLATDYRWERNVDNLQVGGTNLIKNTSNKLQHLERSDWQSLAESGNTRNFNLTDYLGKRLTLRVWIQNPSADAVLQLYFSAPGWGTGNVIKAGQSGYSQLTVDVPVTSPGYWNLVLGKGDGATYSLDYKELKAEIGDFATSWSPHPDDLMLNSNPINSILTTLTAENPSTAIGGTWTQLGIETKFDNTIYYWKRTN